MSITSILFDFDFTLADSSDAVFECANYALKKMGLPTRSYPEVCKTIGMSLTDGFLYLTKESDDNSVVVFRRLFIEKADEVMVDKTVIFEGVEEMLSDLKAQHLKLGIVSTKFRYRILDILNRNGISHRFDIIVGGEDVENHKPDPEGLLKALAELSASKSECLYAGDSRADGEAARRCGVRFAAVGSGVTSLRELREYDPVLTCASVTQLPELISSFHPEMALFHNFCVDL